MFANVYTITDCLVYQKGTLVKANVIVKHNRIYAIEPSLTIGHVIKGNPNWVVAPSFIDIHTHLRYPGQLQNITIATESYAALKGGYGLVCTMANTNPVLDSAPLIINAQKHLSQKSIVDVRLYSALTKHLTGRQIVDFKAISPWVVGFSNDGLGVDDLELMKKLITQALIYDALILMHPQQKVPQQKVLVQDCALARQYNLQGITNANEFQQIADHLKIAANYPDLRYHATHISTKESLEIIRKHKATMPFLSCDVTPHHLLLTCQDLDLADGRHKVNPPLRPAVDVNALIAGLQDNIIDCIVTDHAPHPTAAKESDFITAKPGFINLETTFAALYTGLVLTQKISLPTLIELLSFRPAKIIRHSEPIALQPGNYANFVVIDTKLVRRYQRNHIASGGHNSPFLGQKLQGWVVMHARNGKLFNLQ